MKKILAAVLAVAMLAGMNMTAFAAPATTTAQLTTLTGQPIDEDGKQITDDTIAPNQTIYFLIPNSAARQLNDAKLSKLTVKKAKNAKLVKSVALVEKRLTSGSETALIPSGTATTPPTQDMTSYSLRNRYTYLAVTLNDTTSDAEFKVELDLTFTAKNPPKGKAYAAFPFYGQTTVAAPAAKDNKYTFTATGDKLLLKTSFYVANTQEDGEDASVTVGKKGLTIKPAKNTTNEIVFDNGSDEMATLTFKASSNPSKFYAKLSTNWTSDLLTKFRNTDAVIRKFSPATIDATSRGVLALNNPFDADDYDVDKVYIYSVGAKNKLTNVTSQFSYNEDDDTFETKTRSLGTWIISDVKIKLTK